MKTVFQKGNSGGPGRPRGSKSKITKKSIRRLAARQNITALEHRMLRDYGLEADTMTAAQAIMIRNVATLATECNRLDRKVRDGLPLEVGPYVSMSGAIVRLLTLLGANREPKDMTLVAFNKYIEEAGRDVAAEPKREPELTPGS